MEDFSIWEGRIQSGLGQVWENDILVLIEATLASANKQCFRIFGSYSLGPPTIFSCRSVSQILEILAECAE